MYTIIIRHLNLLMKNFVENFSVYCVNCAFAFRNDKIMAITFESFTKNAQSYALIRFKTCIW